MPVALPLATLALVLRMALAGSQARVATGQHPRMIPLCWVLLGLGCAHPRLGREKSWGQVERACASRGELAVSPGAESGRGGVVMGWILERVPAPGGRMANEWASLPLWDHLPRSSTEARQVPCLPWTLFLEHHPRDALLLSRDVGLPWGPGSEARVPQAQAPGCVGKARSCSARPSLGTRGRPCPAEATWARPAGAGFPGPGKARRLRGGAGEGASGRSAGTLPCPPGRGWTERGAAATRSGSPSHPFRSGRPSPRQTLGRAGRAAAGSRGAEAQGVFPGGAACARDTKVF